MMPDIRLTTERLVVRPPVEADFPAIAAFMRSPRAEHVGGPVADEFAAWRGFLASFGHWAMRDYGFFTVVADGTPVGRVGVAYHTMWDEPELGWQVFDGHEGKGFATEAARAVRAWAHAERGLGPLISYINPANSRSLAVARRLGAHFERDTLLLDRPAQIWRHPAPEGV